MTAIHRHFIGVGPRRVHLRSAGSGPPVVMLHGSPGDSQMLEAEIAAAAASFTVFALDTPGFGHSQALPGETLTLRDLAEATGEAMAALGLPPCPVYGTHTGAAIALELGLGWPQLVSGLVMEGLPAFTQAEMDEFFQGYFAPMIPDPLAGHLTGTWMRFRDQFTWFPWPSRDVRRLNPYGRPTPAEIHLWVSMFYRSCRFYAPAYRAACFYGQAAIRGAAALQVPAIYTATVTDMLHPHLARLPPLRPNQRIAALPSEGPEKFATIAGFLREFAAAPALPAPGLPVGRPIGHDPGLMILNTASNARIMVRCYGDPAQPALIIAHDAPGTGLRAEGLARALSDRFHVIVPDLPGCGESTLAGPDQSVLDEAAASLVSAADALGIAQYAVLGLGCGAAVAARMPRADGARVTSLVLASPPAPDEATAAAIAPALHLSPDGSHWLRAWLMLRDGEIYEPWFNGSVSAQRRTQGNFDAQFLHDQTAALMEGHSTYHVFPRAAWMCDIEAGLRAVSVPVRITTAQAAEIEAILSA